MKTKFLPLAFLLLTLSSLTAKDWEPQAEGLLPSNYSVMNLSIINDSVVWAAAIDFSQWGPPSSNHVPWVLRTTDGGASWSAEEFTQATGRLTYNPDCVLSALEIIAGDIILYPNPATDFLQLQLPETITQTNKVSLFNPHGRLLEQQLYNPGQAVQVGHLPSGFFTLKLVDGAQVYIGRIVKQ